MSDEKPGDIIEERELYSLQTRQQDDYPWVNFGAHRADAFEVLRTHDYRQEHHPDEGVRITLTEVRVRVVDPEVIRKAMEEKKAQEQEAAVQSE